jgi:hypothetical protein
LDSFISYDLLYQSHTVGLIVGLIASGKIYEPPLAPCTVAGSLTTARVAQRTLIVDEGSDQHSSKADQHSSEAQGMAMRPCNALAISSELLQMRAVVNTAEPEGHGSGHSGHAPLRIAAHVMVAEGSVQDRSEGRGCGHAVHKRT